MTQERNVWDTIYASGGYEEEPDEELVSLCGFITTGEALDVGAGDGRHSLWLAAHGWDVEAIDISTQGIANLRKEADAYGLPIRTTVGSMYGFDFPINAYDLVLSTGSALNFLQKLTAKEIIERLKSAVCPGGYVYVTLSTVDDPAYQRHRAEAGQVENDTFWSLKSNCWISAFRPAELHGCFSDFDVISYAERTVHDTHGNPHDHMLAFSVARRPPLYGVAANP